MDMIIKKYIKTKDGVIFELSYCEYGYFYDIHGNPICEEDEIVASADSVEELQ